MARIQGVDIPDNKRSVVSLTYIFGIGSTSAREILEQAGVDPNKRVKEWTEDEATSIRNIIREKYKIEGEIKIRSSTPHQEVDGYRELPWFTS